MTAIAWIRRELRRRDNTALRRAAEEHNTVIPLHVLHRERFTEQGFGYPVVRFWREAVEELEEGMEESGTPLIVRRGNPVDVINDVAQEADADEVFYNRDYTPYARDRQKDIRDGLGIAVKGVKDLVMFEQDEIMTNAGSPYKVYSYYRDKWFERDKPAPRDVPAFTVPDIRSDPLPSIEDWEFEAPEGMEWNWSPGREGGLQRLEQFKDIIRDYSEERDYPGKDATSRLSPHLRFGTISVREAFQAAEDARENGADEDGVRTWQEELAWRDFYFQVLWHWPETTEKAFLKKYRDMEWYSTEAVPARWEAWVNGMTGYPIVDAGMRQLKKTGWMHNRLRMVVTSFACKDLWLDWRDVHSYFKQMFVDAEISAMVGGIQWAYSIGTDAQPYFRVFNPWTQGEDYDPDGAFIREMVPELAEVPDAFIHRPHQMPNDVQEDVGCIIGEDYPEPIVEHGEQREKAVNRFEEAADS